MFFNRFFDFGIIKANNEFQIRRVNRQKTPAIKEAAAGNLKAVTEDLAIIMAQQNLVTKILAIQDGEHSTALVEHAVKMALKLDCEILALDVSDEPLKYSGERREREIKRFYQRAARNAKSLLMKAEEMGVMCRHMVQVGGQEEAIETLSKKDKGIRYVLSKIYQGSVTDTKELEQVRVASKDKAKLVDQKSTAIKILAVQDGEHSSELVDYSVKMAQKLDCEILALDVSDEPLKYSGERKEREIHRFHERASRNAETLQLKAEAMGVTCQHMIQVGSQEETVKKLSKEDKNIRYVLFKPAQEAVAEDRRKARVPVVDLNCSSL